jgi:hypothetical protein
MLLRKKKLSHIKHRRCCLPFFFEDENFTLKCFFDVHTMPSLSQLRDMYVITSYDDEKRARDKI